MLPTVNFTIDCSNACNQWICCAPYGRNHLDNHSVVYESENNELVNVQRRHRWRTLFHKSPRADCDARKETLRVVNLYLEGAFHITVEEAAQKCNIRIEELKDGKRSLKVRDFRQLEEAACALCENKDRRFTRSMSAPASTTV